MNTATYRKRGASAILVFAVAAAALVGCGQPIGPSGTPQADGESAPGPIELVAIDFDGGTAGYTANGYTGAGISTEPEAGYLDADGWSIAGFSDGDLAFGAAADTGDFARGTSAGGVSTGGLYAFTVDDGNVALGVQPTASDFAPGSISLRIPLADHGLSPADLEKATVMVHYSLWVRNNEDRSTRWTCEVSADGENWIVSDEAVVVTGESAGGETWERSEQRAALAADDVGLIPTGTLYVRWVASDEAGTGGRDECAIDDIRISLEP